MIIRIAGLPGSGKTTLGESLAEELDYELFRIDFYRNNFDDEFKALTALFYDMYVEEDDFILDSTGFNPRIHWVFQFLKARVIDVKLICEKEILRERIKEKKDGGFFPYPTTRAQYTDDYFVDMEHKHADITINTSHLTKESMVRCALENLHFYGVEKPKPEFFDRKLVINEEGAKILLELAEEQDAKWRDNRRVTMDARFGPYQPLYPCKPARPLWLKKIFGEEK